MVETQAVQPQAVPNPNTCHCSTLLPSPYSQPNKPTRKQLYFVFPYSLEGSISYIFLSGCDRDFQHI